MGIPSYYKKLTATHPGLVRSHHPDRTIDWLFMDFNCLIYHCIQQPDMTPYQGDNKEWETELLTRVVTYTEEVIQRVAPSQGVYLAIDGVVPMAKMRQQRLRRFKSQWLASRVESVKWDTNAITPGTPFMAALHVALEGAARRSSTRWTISTSNEPGEGEHKIIAEWRKGGYSGNYAIYGLDADLIVLSLLTREVLQLQNEVWLFREEIDKGACVYRDGSECFEWFAIHELRAWLARVLVEEDAIRSYCAAMSVLGNDFLPRSLGFTLREDGHAELLLYLQNLQTPLVHPITQEMDTTALFSFFQSLAETEEERLVKTLKKRRRMCQIYGNSETGIGESNWPLVQEEEMALMRPDGELDARWREMYVRRFFPGFSFTRGSIQRITEDYLYGIQWIWAYYTGQSEKIDYDWYYPHSLPPLWSWIAEHTELPTFPNKVRVSAEDIDPQEQLGLVLPLKSWGLIRHPVIRQLPRLLPHYFPTDFTFESVGKRFFWECEANIPVLSLSELKTVLEGIPSSSS